MISDFVSDLKEKVKVLDKKYTEYSIDELANKYCEKIDAADQDGASVYISALMLRFWYQVDKMYRKVYQLGFEREDCVDKLYELIDVACQYRAWQNPAKHTNAQASINQVIATRGVPAIIGGYAYKKRAGKFYEVSMDSALDSDSELTLRDTLACDESEVTCDSTYSIIQQCIKNNKVVEAIIADLIAHGDTLPFKVKEKKEKYVDSNGEERSIKTNTYEFWDAKVIKELDAIGSAYRKYFTDTYSISESLYDLATEVIKTSSASRKKKMISSTTSYLKTIML